MRFFALCLLLTACDARDALTVPEADTDAPVCEFVFKQETGDCDERGAGYWTPPEKSVYTIFRCTADGICFETGVTVTNGVAEFLCSENGKVGDYYRVDYITP